MYPMPKKKFTCVCKVVTIQPMHMYINWMHRRQPIPTLLLRATSRGEEGIQNLISSVHPIIVFAGHAFLSNSMLVGGAF